MPENTCHAHVRPLVPATEPEPMHPVRSRDLVKYRATVLGYSAAQGADPKGTMSFEAFSAGVELVLDYLRVWDKRRQG